MTRVHKISVELTTSQLLGLAQLLASPGFNPELICGCVPRANMAMAAVEATTRLMAAVDQEVRKK